MWGFRLPNSNPLVNDARSCSPADNVTAFVPFGQPSVPLRTPVVSPLPTGAASSSVLPQPHVAAFPNGGNELPQFRQLRSRTFS